MAGLVLVTMMAQSVWGATPMLAELADAATWTAVVLQGKDSPEPLATNTIEVVSNNDPVQVNSRGGKPLCIAGETFTQGLYCHAVSEVIVRLAKPAARFEAIAGVDSNEQTSGGRGSVVFSVCAGGKTLWESPLMREGMPGVPVSVDLGDVKELRLLVGDGGDGIACDQSDWANARIVFSDGTDLWVSALPIAQPEPPIAVPGPVFSFIYGGAASSDFLSSWGCERDARPIDESRTAYTIRYKDPKTGLLVTCEAVGYHQFPTVEWTLYFENTGKEDTPIIENIQALDTVFARSAAGEFVLHHHTGDNCTADSFEPHAEVLNAGREMRLASEGGRPTTGAFPYFNIALPERGVIAVVSWAGQWAAQFHRDTERTLRVRAGQEQTHFVLHPGERVRTPMIVLQFWRGDRLHAQNVWRAWMIAHNMPRPGGNLPPVPQLAACSSHQFGEMIHANTENQKFFVDKYLERGIRLDYWWMDAGWYVNETGWPNTGTWEVDTQRFPGGLRPICDHARAKGVKSIVWFEPERVTAGTWLAVNHPEWILGGADGGLLDLGNPEAHEWLTNHVDRLLTEQGIDLYRQDFNMSPLPHWRGNDTEDRQGITEIRHVEGYLAYWDELRKRHPDMLIDSCASGGRRNDLETLRRAAPLLRSDYIMEPVGNQCHTHAISLWFPFYGTGTSKTDPYLILSTMCPHFTACWDMRDGNLDYAALSRLVEVWKSFVPYYMGDFYPLTPYTLGEDQWIAWQFHRTDQDAGVVQAFRRGNSIYEAARLPLSGLDADTVYVVTGRWGSEDRVEMTGAELMRDGLPVSMDTRPQAVVFTYGKKTG